MYALIGGSGFEGNDVIRVTEEVEMTTPYGAPSAPIVFGTLGGVEIAFLRRHGVRHEYAPHRVPALGPGALAVPDQLIDYTWGREVTYFDSPETGVRHVDMTWPFDRSLSRRLVMAAGRLGVAVEEKGVYAATQGPRLETAAEVERMRRDGADMIGMTLYPECALARELGLSYAGLCVSVNHAAGMGESAESIDFEGLKDAVAKAVLRADDVVTEVVRD